MFEYIAISFLVFIVLAIFWSRHTSQNNYHVVLKEIDELHAEVTKIQQSFAIAEAGLDRVADKLEMRYSDIISFLTMLVERLEEYYGHLEKIYDLEMFHGDETLRALMNHTRETLGFVGDFAESLEPMIKEIDEEAAISRQKEESRQ